MRLGDFAVISYELSEEQEIIRSTMRELAQNVLAPKARKHDLDSALSDEALDAIWQSGVIQLQAEAGERSPLNNAIILEELAAGDGNVAMATSAACAFVAAITDLGSDGQRALLKNGLQGTQFTTGVIAGMEPGFARDVTQPRTTARRAGDDFVVTGSKILVPLAKRASHFLVIADLDGATDAFIVPRDAAGLTVTSEEVLGMRGSEMGQVKLDGVAVPADMRLGTGNGADVQRLFDSSRIGASAIMLGQARAVMAHIIPYTKERIVHGTPLARKQKVAFDIADMRMETDIMRWMVWKAAWALQEGVSATRPAQLAYTYASQQVMQIADNGVQAMGGHGYVEEHPMEMWYRNARSLSVLEAVAGV